MGTQGSRRNDDWRDTSARNASARNTSTRNARDRGYPCRNRTASPTWTRTHRSTITASKLIDWYSLYGRIKSLYCANAAILIRNGSICPKCWINGRRSKCHCWRPSRLTRSAIRIGSFWECSSSNGWYDGYWTRNRDNSNWNYSPWAVDCWAWRSCNRNKRNGNWGKSDWNKSNRIWITGNLHNQRYWSNHLRWLHWGRILLQRDSSTKWLCRKLWSETWIYNYTRNKQCTDYHSCGKWPNNWQARRT